jgi:hypothetical protein
MEPAGAYQGGAPMIWALGILGGLALLALAWRILGLRRCGNCGRWTADPGGFIVGHQVWECCPYCVEKVVETIKAGMFQTSRKENEIRRIGAFNERTGERGILEPWRER